MKQHHCFWGAWKLTTINITFVNASVVFDAVVSVIFASLFSADLPETIRLDVRRQILRQSELEATEAALTRFVYVLKNQILIIIK